MAQVTVPIASFAGGLVVVSIRYNDQTYDINRILAVNDSDYPVLIRATKPGYSDQERLVDAHSSSFQPLSSLKFEYLLDEGDDEDGNPLGYNISLGDVTIGARWPS